MKIFEKMEKAIHTNKFIIIALIASFISIYFTGGRSFWIDEAMLALAINASSITDFIPLSQYEQATPLIHFLLSKFIIYFIGKNDFFLRLTSLLFFIFSICFALNLLKSKFEKFALLCVIYSSPEIVRYAFEFKHYIIEFAFSIIIISTWLSGKERNGYVSYAFATILSVFATYSLIFIIFPIFILEAYTSRNIDNKKFQKKWFMHHAMYIALFVTWHLLVNKPSTYFQLQNWSESYNPGLLSLNPLNLKLWARAPFNAVLIIGGYKYMAFMGLMLIPWIALKAKKIEPPITSLRKLLLLFIISIAAINFASLIGFYPIQSTRHFLFLAPIIIYITINFAKDLFDFYKINGYIAIVSILMLGCISHYKYQYFFQETKKLISSNPDIDTTFIGAQPAYQWYSNSKDKTELVGEINSTTSKRITANSEVEDFNSNIIRPGAWPWIWSLLKKDGNFDLYISWLAITVSRKNNSTILFSHHSTSMGSDIDSMKIFISKLPPSCKSFITSSDINSHILFVNCQAI